MCMSKNLCLNLIDVPKHGRTTYNPVLYAYTFITQHVFSFTVSVLIDIKSLQLGRYTFFLQIGYSGDSPKYHTLQQIVSILQEM